MYFYEVLLPFAWSKFYTYQSYKVYQVGQLINVPVGKKTSIGVIFKNIDTYQAQNSCHDHIKIKDIISTTRIKINPNILTWILKCSEYNATPVGILLQNVLASYKENLQDDCIYYKNINDNNSILPISNILLNMNLRQFKKLCNNASLIPYNLQSLYHEHLIAYIDHTSMRKDQSAAYHAIMNTNKVCVLQGDTGSGKTKVYMQVALQMMREGQVLILLPEVALTQEFSDRIYREYDIYPMVWNHTIHEEAKNRIWQWATMELPGLIIGSRSALWLPFNNLKCIIIDEEHDLSYKQDTSPTYHAVHMSIMRCNIIGAKCILVSATPSIETIYNIGIHKYQCVSLTKKHISKIIYGKLEKQSWLSNELKEQMQIALSKKQQIMLFLNKRGFATKIMCVSCNQYMKCDHCDTYMIYHINDCIRCPICNVKQMICKCKQCQVNTWRLYGIGIEKIVQELRILFPNAITEIFSSDIHNIQEQIQLIHENKIDIIVTTQVLTKGYDFANVHCVGIIQVADTHTTLDPRYNERMMQMLVQVKGRCGRHNDTGTLVIQASERNPLVDNIITHNMQNWLHHEMQMRRKFELPPFYRLIKIIISSTSYALSCNTAQTLYSHLQSELSEIENCNIYPPAQTYLFKSASKFRYYILIKSPKKIYLQENIKNIVQQYQSNHKYQIKIDVDPYIFD